MTDPRTETKKPLPQTAKGVRPHFFKDPISDHLLSMVLALSNELWVVRERLDTIEALAEERQLFTAADIEDFAPDPSRDEKREQMRQDFLDRIFYLLREEVEDTARGDTREAYERIVRDAAAQK